MKGFTIVVAAILLCGSVSYAQDRQEKDCAEKVKSIATAIESSAKIRAPGKKTSNISVNELLTIQQEQGSCAAEDEYYRRNPVK